MCFNGDADGDDNDEAKKEGKRANHVDVDGGEAIGHTVTFAASKSANFVEVTFLFCFVFAKLFVGTYKLRKFILITRRVGRLCFTFLRNFVTKIFFSR